MTAPITARGFEMLMAFRVAYGREEGGEKWRLYFDTGRLIVNTRTLEDKTVCLPANENEFERLTAALVARKLTK